MNLRQATFDDEKLLLEWRNDPTVLAVSSVSDRVSAEQHHQWIARALHDEFVYLYVAEVDGVPIGQGRIERAWKAISFKMDTAIIGYSIASEHRKKGYGKQLAYALVKQARAKGFYMVGCRIKRTNMCSVAVAVKAGVNTIEFF